jgi:mortality factor 4-like protein 1
MLYRVKEKALLFCVGGCTWTWLTWHFAIFSWDDWVPQDRLRKFTEENRELATTLRREAEAAFRQKSTKSSTKKKGGSDRSSARGSEERQMSVPGRGTKRARDNDIEKVSMQLPFVNFQYLPMALAL